MRATAHLVPMSALAFVGLALGGATTAAQGPAAHTHIGHVMDGFGDTPDGQSLLATALAEAAIAAQHAALAAEDPNNLRAMKRHAEHVLNAVDPSEQDTGPGLGYGVKQAAAGIAQHIELAAKSDGASQGVMTHAEHVATSANNTVQRADSIIALAKAIEMLSGRVSPESPDAASALVSQLTTLAEQLITGVDANGDGRIGWQQGEGGLEQAEQHMNLMKKGEGLGC